jgi:hypothetical protein
MKHCYVHDHRDQRPVMKNGKQRRFPSFKWFLLYQNERGWRANLFCFLDAITDDLNWWSHRGVFCWGVWDNQPFFEITLNDIPWRISCK